MNEHCCENQDIFNEISMHLGEIKGTLAAIQGRQTEITEWIGGLDNRLRAVESRSAVFGMLSGGGVAMVVTALGQYFRDKLSG
ncbi:MAG: hypothetical protein HQL63_06675 [Magnetococcales bacterium]|nr:hypothetical protein [Magnetococcales bacterium]